MLRFDGMHATYRRACVPIARTSSGQVMVIARGKKSIRINHISRNMGKNREREREKFTLIAIIMIIMMIIWFKRKFRRRVKNS